MLLDSARLPGHPRHMDTAVLALAFALPLGFATPAVANDKADIRAVAKRAVDYTMRHDDDFKRGSVAECDKRGECLLMLEGYAPELGFFDCLLIIRVRGRDWREVDAGCVPASMPAGHLRRGASYPKGATRTA